VRVWGRLLGSVSSIGVQSMKNVLKWAAAFAVLVLTSPCARGTCSNTPIGGNFTCVQAIQNDSGGGAASGTPYTIGSMTVRAGHFLLVGCQLGAPGTLTGMTPSDSQGNTYQQIIPFTLWRSNTAAEEVFWVKNAIGGSTTFKLTASYTGSGGADTGCEVVEMAYTGPGTLSVDVTASVVSGTTGSAGQTQSADPMTTTANGDLIVAYNDCNNGRQAPINPSQSTAPSGSINYIAVGVQTTAGSYTVQSSDNNGNDPFFITGFAIKATSSGPAPSPPTDLTVESVS
jgi:hypothetical protein